MAYVHTQDPRRIYRLTRALQVMEEFTTIKYVCRDWA
jgi:hypothetical protein